ncbi:carbohydrate deacetylase [Clostridium sp. CCUG 7971]|uniref:carbohydrate deacetylase n=1 Tax=Clostridium sp. CCUG 7971 TaxID=2811414 RepID=UPI00336BAF66
MLKIYQRKGETEIKRLIINADDFGYSHAVNLGIAESHINGVLTSTTLMANMPGTKHAVELSKKMPDLGIGVHLTLTCGKPILGNSVSSLIKEDGYFYKLSDFEKGIVNINKNELYSEWKAQIDRLYSYGIKLSHIDSHHHIHTFEEPSKVVEMLSKEYNLPVRNCNKATKNSEINFLDLCNYDPIRDMTTKYMSVRELCFKVIESNILKNIEFEKSEAMCHPAFLDSPLLEGSSFNIARIREVDILCDSYMKELIDKYDIELCNYNNI